MTGNENNNEVRLITLLLRDNFTIKSLENSYKSQASVDKK